MKTLSWPEDCWLRALFGRRPGNRPCRGLPHLPSLELLLIAIWLFLVSSSVCWVQARRSILLWEWACVSCGAFIWQCFDTEFVRAPTGCWELVSVSRSWGLFFCNQHSHGGGENPPVAAQLSASKCEVGTGGRNLGI